MSDPKIPHNVSPATGSGYVPPTLDCLKTRPVLTLSGSALGAFAARLACEAWSAPLPDIAVMSLTGLCIALATYWLYRLADRSRPPTPATSNHTPNSNPHVNGLPALLVLIYVVWPERDWRVASAVAMLAVLTWAIMYSRACHATSKTVGGLSVAAAPEGKHNTRIIASQCLPGGLVFLVSLLVYGLTLQKDVLPADSGEFQLIASKLGVAHPPGYPLYTMVGKLFTLLTPARPALGLNLMSAVLAAATLALVFEAVRRFAGERGGNWGGLAAALALGGSTTFWAQATTANIRMPTMFFLAWCINEISIIGVSQPGSPGFAAALTRLALALSLGLGHHPSLAFIGVFIVLYVPLAKPALIRSPHLWLRALTAFALGQLAWLYLPIRAAMGALSAPEGLDTLRGFLFHVLAQGFAGDMFYFASPDRLPGRLAVLPTLFQFQFNPALLAASAFGALVCLRRNWRLGWLLAAGWATHVFITITYRAPQTVEYMMPAYLLQVVGLGISVGVLVGSCEWRVTGNELRVTSSKTHVSRFTPDAVRLALYALLPAAVVLAGLINGIDHAPGYIQLAGDRSTRAYVTPILQDAPPGALILADWHWATPMEYLQMAEGMRPDVSIEYVYPVGGVEYAARWLERIDAEVAHRPVVVTRYDGVAYATTRYTFQPLGQAFRVLDRPGATLPVGFRPLQLDFEGQIALVGYRLERDTFQAGQVVALELAWKSLTQAEYDYSFTVRLLDGDGQSRAQRDRATPASAYAPGEVHVESFVLPLAAELPPGAYQIAVGLYYALPEGGWRNLQAGEQILAQAASIEVKPSTQRPITQHRLDIPFESGVRLVGVDYDLSDPATLRVYLHWQRQRQPALIAALKSGLQTEGNDAGVTPAGIIHVLDGKQIKEQALPQLPDRAYFSTVHDFSLEGNLPALSLTLRQPSGAAIKWADAWGLAHTHLALPRPLSSGRYVLLGEQLLLTGVTSKPTRLQAGRRMELELAFTARQALVSDNSMSVRLEHQDGAWWLPQDTKPALDTARTLKWISGSRILDPHVFDIPADSPPGQAEAHLKVYDEFRQAILPPLDGRMGDSVLLGTWQISEDDSAEEYVFFAQNSCVIRANLRTLFL